MNIKSASALQSNDDEISNICKTTGEPVYLTKNGEGDLVVMDITAFERRVKELHLAEQLLNVRAARINGAKGNTIEDSRDRLHLEIEQITHRGMA